MLFPMRTKINFVKNEDDEDNEEMVMMMMDEDCGISMMNILRR